MSPQGSQAPCERSVIPPRYLLWVDCSAALSAGAAIVSLSGWLSGLYALPREFLVTIGAVNVAYGLYSFSLAVRERRPQGLIVFLVVANATWSAVCWIAALALATSASLYGIAHLVLEGLFVAGLAVMEWKQRALLSSPSWPVPAPI
jgi:hypothetical protein